MVDPRLALIAHDGAQIDLGDDLVCLAWCFSCAEEVSDLAAKNFREVLGQARWHAEIAHGPEAVARRSKK